MAVGTYNDGSLTGGINLTDEGAAYYHYTGSDFVDGNDWGTLALINTIEGGGRRYDDISIYRMGILDLSLQNGGLFPQHASHQNGCDVDARYARKDHNEARINIYTDPDDYDVDSTVKIINALVNASRSDPGASDALLLIVSKYANIQLADDETELTLIIDTEGHRDNFHLRITDPNPYD